jgi:hypothetical protein
MSDVWAERRVYRVEECARCGKPHSLNLEVIFEHAQEVALFGGSENLGPRSKNVRRWDVSYLCEETGEPALAKFELAVDPGLTIVRVRPLKSGEPLIQLTNQNEGARSGDRSTRSPAAADLLRQDLAEWIKTSSSTPRDYCKAMVTTSTAAIPVLFTLLKFLGYETANQTWVAIAGSIIAGLMLLAAVGFILAMRPRFEIIDVEGFEEWRSRRLARMNLFIGAATIIFVIAVTASLILFGLILASS